MLRERIQVNKNSAFCTIPFIQPSENANHSVGQLVDQWLRGYGAGGMGGRD